MTARPLLFALALCALAPAAGAQNQALDALKNKFGDGKSLGGLALPAIGSTTMGNTAGVLQYCVKNNYLSADAATGVKNRLLGMVTGSKTQQAGYDNGSQGLLQGSDGKSFNLKKVGGKLKTRACDYVLQNARALV